jgi:hypothetical protein
VPPAVQAMPLRRRRPSQIKQVRKEITMFAICKPVVGPARVLHLIVQRQPNDEKIIEKIKLLHSCVSHVEISIWTSEHPKQEFEFQN